MVVQEDAELNPLYKHTKILLHVEQFSLKTNWKLGEELLYNQVSKKKKKAHKSASKGSLGTRLGSIPLDRLRGKIKLHG